CGSGAGVCVAANKVDGVRAAMAINPRQARKMKEDDDINVVCLANDFVVEEENMEIINEFLRAVFASEERFIRRIQKIKQYEKSKVS
ncbi:MAG TPA: RpiB/LacA/LacB family sugar-phosphate isomerase, partial [Candidatus Woesebacteria bacterium]|nr:RpiB/LacA/LacB family sugar-phosphate isomerase [Candidatus Woesebacteria bacterium]